jgi:hypothetical protein
VIRLPLYSIPPYKLTVAAVTLMGRRSKLVEDVLACPAEGCLEGDAPPPHGPLAHARHFPLRGVDRVQLERSFREAIDAIARAAPHMRYAARCTSRSSCSVTYTDPLYPRRPYRVEYRIEGEQARGCWLVSTWKRIGEPPYEDAFWAGPEAGCVGWLG